MNGQRTGDLRPGMTLGDGRFVLIRRIGEGGTADVFEAEDTLAGRRVAVKVLSPRFARDPAAVQRFRREARAAAMVVHPHVVTVLEVIQSGSGPLCIVQELLTGTGLREHLDTWGRLEPSEAIDLLAPVMVALVAIHDRGIIHRDIKPENIFLVSTPTGALVPKLIDFGTSKMNTDSMPSTRPGLVLGTPYYLSPDVLRGGEASAQADAWSVGVVLFEMLVGRPPFVGSSFPELVDSICNAVAPRVDSLVPGSPAGLADVVQQALERDPARRFASMRDFLRALLDFARRHDPALADRHAPLAATVGL